MHKVISIVVTYNGIHWIDRCLGSLQDPGTPTHIIVVDNCSTDGTQRHIEEVFPCVELIRAEANLGFGQANNIGLRMALERNAEHVLLLNQDAWVLPSTIGQLIQHAEREPGYGVLSPMHLNGEGDALDLAFSKYIAPGKCPGLFSDITMGRVKDQVYPVDFVNAAAWLLSRKCLMTVGGFNPSFFHYGEDDNYIDRMRYHKLLVGIVPTAWAHHDREQRIQDTVNAGQEALLIRKAALKYSDPDSHASPQAKIRALRSTMMRCLLSGQRAAYQVARNQVAILCALPLDALAKHQEASRSVGPTFL